MTSGLSAVACNSLYTNYILRKIILHKFFHRMKTTYHRLLYLLIVLLALDFTNKAAAETYNFTTLAGSGSNGSMNGSGSTAQFNAPWGIAVDSAGNVYVSEGGGSGLSLPPSHLIRKISPTGVVSTLAGSLGSSGLVDGQGTNAKFSYPRGLAVDSEGNVYVADSGNNAVRKITPSGLVSTVATGFSLCSALVLDGTGNMYVTDSNSSTIKKVNIATGNVITIAGSNMGYKDGTGAAANFSGPSGICISKPGTLIASEYYNNTLRSINLATNEVTTLAGLGQSAGSMDGTNSAAKFSGPMGIASDNTGNTYVADYNNHTIRKVYSSGTVSTIGGIAGTADFKDGLSGLAKFNFPATLALDKDGNIYVADMLNNRVRKGSLQSSYVLSASADNNYSAFLLDDGSLWASGNGPSVLSKTAEKKAENVSSVYTGPSSLFFIKKDNSLWGSSFNNYGQLGNGTQDPVVSAKLIASGVSSAACGSSHTLFIKTDGSLWGMGTNQFGELGNSLSSVRPTLLPVLINTGIKSVVAGNGYTLYIDNNNTLWGVGNNSSGQLGDGSLVNRSAPVKIRQGVMAAFTVSGGSTSLFIEMNGALFGMGSNNYGQLGGTAGIPCATPSLLANNVVQASVGSSHILFVKNDNSLWALGNNDWSQFGNATLTSASTPVQLGSNVVSASAGYRHSIYIKADKSLWVSGYNQCGELADGTTNEQNKAINLSAPIIGGIKLSNLITNGDLPSIYKTDGNNNFISQFYIQSNWTNPIPTATYAWFKDGTAFSPVSGSGSTVSNYNSTGFIYSLPGTYTVIATNWIGSSSQSIIATQILPIKIKTQPTDQTISEGDAITFTINATGSGPVNYQWVKSGVIINNATEANYTIPKAAYSDAGRYSVIITNPLGSVTSSTFSLDVNLKTAPSIISQPESQSVSIGKSVTLTVAASGTAPLTYQWSKNGTAISGATAASLTFSSAAASDAGSYTVVVTNTLGTVTSAAAVLTIYTPPTITVQPTAQAVVAGSTLTLSVTASGTGTLTYQWIKGGVAISGATSSTFSIANCTASDAGSYWVTVSIIGASVTSSTVSVTVNTPPTITSQPVSALTYDYNFYVGSRQPVLYVSANGTAPLNYQWYKNGTAINGAIASSYTFSYDTADQTGSYYVVISNLAGSATSNSTTVAGTPRITAQPVSSSAATGTSTSFSVVASGSPTLTYQWYKNSSPIAGATGSSYTFTSAATTDAGGYAVIVSNAYGTATSSTVTLTVTPAPSAPTITTQPTSQSVISSFSSSFSVSASGTAPFTYVWRKDGSTVVGGNSSSLTLNNTTSANAGSYTVTITNSLGSATSTAATLTVNDPATTFTQRKRTSGSSNSLWSFAYGNSTMVAVGSPGLLYTSTDGVTWTQRASGTNEWIVGVAYGNNQFVAVGDNGRILRSTDGILWTYAANEGTIFRLNGVIYAGDRWVAVGENGVIVTSTDANTWSPVLSGTTRFLHGLAYYEGCIIATGGSGTILSSSDGLTWTARNSGTTNDLEACAVVGNYFMAVGSAGECLFSYVKLGGSSWTNNTKYKPNTTARLRALASGAGAAIAFTDSGTAFYLPSIYGTWTQLPLSTSTTYLTAGFAQNRFYGLGTGEVIVQSEPFFAGRLGNLSTRGQTGLGGDVLISGLVVTGSSPKQMLIRAAGPALTNFGVSGALNKPILTLFDSTGTAIASNTGWNQSPNDSDIRSASIAAGAFAFPENSADSALLIRLLPGSYTAQVTGVNNTTGTTLIETYDMESVQTMQSKMINISSRGVVGSGQNIIIPGISVGGSSSRILLIRAVGPTLGAFGVTGTLSNPTISVVQTVNGINTTLATNDDWESQNSTVTFTAAEVRDLSTKAGAFTLPSGSKDAALLFSTSTNTSYTVLVSGANGETGVALVEVYDVTGL